MGTTSLLQFTIASAIVTPPGGRGGSTPTTLNETVTQTQLQQALQALPSCGNNICEENEQFSCIQDCPPDFSFLSNCFKSPDVGRCFFSETGFFNLAVLSIIVILIFVFVRRETIKKNGLKNQPKSYRRRY